MLDCHKEVCARGERRAGERKSWLCWRHTLGWMPQGMGTHGGCEVVDGLRQWRDGEAVKKEIRSKLGIRFN